MVIAAIFWSFLLAALGLIMIRGGPIERLFTVVLLSSTAVTFIINFQIGFVAAQNALFAIDVMILFVVLGIVHRSHAYWPIWFAGFHSIIVATDLARLIFPDAVPGIYINAAAFWSLPSLLALVLGTLADHRMRAAALVPG